MQYIEESLACAPLDLTHTLNMHNCVCTNISRTMKTLIPSKIMAESTLLSDLFGESTKIFDIHQKADQDLRGKKTQFLNHFLWNLPLSCFFLC